MTQKKRRGTKTLWEIQENKIYLPEFCAEPHHKVLYVDWVKHVTKLHGLKERW
jgi:hypothetical protein